MGYNNEWVRRCGSSSNQQPGLPSPPLMYNAAFMRFITQHGTKKEKTSDFVSREAWRIGSEKRSTIKKKIHNKKETN